MKRFLAFVALTFAGLSACDSGETLTEMARNQAAPPPVLPPEPPPDRAVYNEPEEKPGPEETAYLRRPRPAKGIRVAPDEVVYWELEGHDTPVRYRMGPFQVDVRAIPKGPPAEDDYALEVAVKAAGHAPRKLREPDPALGFGAFLGYGHLKHGRLPYVLVQTTWGPIMDMEVIKAAVLYPDGIRIVDLHHPFGGVVGTDGDGAMPSDKDGDGMVDFIVDDGALAYAFAPPGWYRLPPRILNIVDGKVVDISRKRGFRRVYAEFARGAREHCLSPTTDNLPNAACAAYVAAAARSGTFDQAWREVMAGYDREALNGLKDCRRPGVSYYDCPSELQIVRSYPDALRRLLQQTGYWPVRQRGGA